MDFGVARPFPLTSLPLTDGRATMIATQYELPSLGETIRQALTLQESIYVAVQQSPRGLWVALIVVGLAGLSQALGQSLVLFANHVRPRRFILALLAAAVGYVVGYLLWAASVWLVGVFAFGAQVTWVAVAATVGLAYAPQIFAFFELTPFFGSMFGVLLTLWSLLAIVIAVRAGLGLETWQAVVASSLGWLLLQIWRNTLGRPVYALGRWIEQRAAGVPLRYRATDVAKLRRRPAWLQTIDPWHTRRGREAMHSPLAHVTDARPPDKDATA
jgi:hypothetical protein